MQRVKAASYDSRTDGASVNSSSGTKAGIGMGRKVDVGTWLGALGNLDLQLVGVDQELRCDTKPARCDLSKFETDVS